MPKMKTHSGTKDRIRVTKKGKAMRGNAGKNHLLQKKSTARKRRLNIEQPVAGKQSTSAKRKLGLK